jgi:molybdenum cofactor synthesis domain-containing protein
VIILSSKKYYKALEINQVRDLLDEYFIFTPKIEEIIISEADHRVLSQNIISPINVPHFKRSMRDGFAVKAKDTYDADEQSPIELKIVGNIMAGELPKIEINDEECIQIATGAPIPRGADAVVMVEYANLKDENKVEIYRSAYPNQYVINIGNDIKKGNLLLEKHRRLNPRDIGALAAVGMKTVKVYTLPKIALFSTGNEIIPLDEDLKPGKVYDINSYTLLTSIKRTGAFVRFEGILPDDLNQAKKILKKYVTDFDLIILSGGTSKGIGDIFPSIVPELGELELFIHGIRVKPGKPTLIATLKVDNRRKLLTLLPGYPTSALTIFKVFLKEHIMKWTKYPKTGKEILELELAERVYSELGRREFKTIKIIEQNGVKYAQPTKTGSDAITTLMGMDGYFEIPEQTQFLEKGENIKVILFD